MAVTKQDREWHFPKIESKYGKPMRYWFGVMKEIKDRKYPEQISYLCEEHGFSRTHANALVLYSRGSKSSRKFSDLQEFLSEHDALKKRTVKKIFSIIKDKYPQPELVIAWNQPMLKLNESYIFGLSVSKNHITISPFNENVFREISPLFSGYRVNKKTIVVPSDWKVDEKLLLKMISLGIKEAKSK
jgi:uncharacterized protein YdhG (YjbR/CyaY superfamily)